MRIGLLTDTHLPSTIRNLWDEVKTAFAGVDLILHGGDIVTPRVIDWLADIAPTLAARGNNDSGWDDPRVKDIHWLDLEGWRVAMIHDMEPEDRPLLNSRNIISTASMPTSSSQAIRISSDWTTEKACCKSIPVTRPIRICGLLVWEQLASWT